jgi:hypothetical protein
MLSDAVRVPDTNFLGSNTTKEVMDALASQPGKWPGKLFNPVEDVTRCYPIFSHLTLSNLWRKLSRG